MTSKQAKIILLALFFSGIILASFLWVKNHSYIEISVLGSSNNKVSYSIKNEATGDIKTFSTSEKMVKKMVKKGSYSVVVTQENRKAVFLFKASGYLKSTHKSQSLEHENQRSFVGLNPNTCMRYVSVLYSFDCDSSYDTLKKHMPGSSSGPTYTVNGEANALNILDIQEYDKQPFIVTQDTSTEDAAGYIPSYAKLRDDLTTADSTALYSLPPSPKYKVNTYLGSSLFYGSKLDAAYSFKTPDSRPSKIQLATPETKKLDPIELSTYHEDIGTYFSEPYLGSEIVGETDNDEMIKGKSEFIIQNKGGKSRHFFFDHIYESGVMCGDQRFCLIAKQKLHIYDVSTGKPKLIYEMGDVKEVSNQESSLIIITSYGVVKLSDTLTGYVVYTFGDYSYCGTHIDTINIIVCVANQSNQRNALLINTELPDTDSIDKKILKLSGSTSIKSLSIYGNYIYIVQNAGEREYIPEKHEFFYPQYKIDAATLDINKKLSTEGIDKLPYSIQYNY